MQFPAASIRIPPSTKNGPKNILFIPNPSIPVQSKTRIPGMTPLKNGAFKKSSIQCLFYKKSISVSFKHSNPVLQKIHSPLVQENP
jgi:hypothetical protein